MKLIQVSGITSLNTVFPLVFALTHNEDTEFFCWFLPFLTDKFTEAAEGSLPVNSVFPHVIVTDYDCWEGPWGRRFTIEQMNKEPSDEQEIASDERDQKDSVAAWRSILFKTVTECGEKCEDLQWMFSHQPDTLRYLKDQWM
ncbi:hypothetical protein ACHAPM_011742, partial [Fusarium culmorum]